MSELKAGIIVTPHNEGMSFSRDSDHVSVTEGETEFYLKSEADKVIEELKHQRDGAFGLANSGLTLDDFSQMAKKEIDRQKYKRCLAMAKWCNYWANYWECCEPPDCSLFIIKAKYYRKWLDRWNKLAEQFKEDE